MQFSPTPDEGQFMEPGMGGAVLQGETVPLAVSHDLMGLRG